MKHVPLIDICDDDLPIEIFLLLSSDYIEVKGNDLVYAIYPWDNLRENNIEEEEKWLERIEVYKQNNFDRKPKGYQARMKRFLKKPCSYKESNDIFKKYLKANGVKDNEDPVYLNYWW